MTVLAVGAHPDDVELCCFGTLARCVRRGDTVVVCSTTNGNLGHTEIESNRLRAIRMAEAARSAEVIGASYCTLDANDMQLDSTDARIRLGMTELIRSVRPDVIITHDPGDYHPDHVETSRLVLYCSVQAALALVETESPSLEKPFVLYHMDKVGGGQFNPTEYVDITSVFALKAEAIGCHVSQIGWLKAHDGIDMVHAMEVLAEFRGMQCGTRYAEAFRSCDSRAVAAKRFFP